MTLTNQHSSEVRAYLTEFLLEELDPSVHPSARAFFRHLKPETAELLTGFFNNYNRAVIDAAFDMRAALERLAEHTMGFDAESDTMRFASDFLTSFFPALMDNYSEVEPVLGALRGFEDDGLAIALGQNATHLAAELITDQGLEVIENRYLEATKV